jgi:transketolase
MSKKKNLVNISKKYRQELFEKFLQVGQGHPGSVFSIIDILVCLFYENFIRFDKKKSKFHDKIIISKGHATVALYPILKNFGVLPAKEWNNWGKKDFKSQLRVFGNTSIPGIDATTGSLGHGLGVGCGLALSYKKDKVDKDVYVIISEGELYEGSTWEAMLFAKHYNLNNLKIIVDQNLLIILGKTDDCLKLSPINDKLKGFGFDVIECDGHNIQHLKKAFSKKTKNLKIILANTIKGKGFSIMENVAKWHYWNPLNNQEIEKCRAEIK